MRGRDLDVYSSASEGRSREVLRHFEAARGFFSQVLGEGGHSHTPACIVVFGSEKEWTAHRAMKFAAAYYRPGFTCDYIVMGPGSSDHMSVAVHEYVHLIVRSSRLDLPIWLNEGLAELYSTIQPQGDKIVVGTPISQRLQALRAGRWAPLSAIVSASRDSAYYNEEHKADHLYNEGWALTHMLSLSDEYRPGFQSLLVEIRNGTDSAEALRKVYHKSIDQIEDELRKYADKFAFRSLLFPATLDSKGAKGESGPVEPYLLKLRLADIDYQPEHAAETRMRLAALTEQSPDRPEAYHALAGLALVERRSAEGFELMERAFSLGERNPRLLWDYGRMLASRDPQRSAAVFARLLEREPDRVDVRSELALAQLGQDDVTAARQTIMAVKDVDAVDAPRYFYAMAMVAQASNSPISAKAAATRMAEFARTPREKEEAARLLASLSAPPRQRTAPVALTTPQPPAQPRPAARAPQQPEQSSPTAPPPSRPTLEGSLVEVRCLGQLLRMVIETDGRRRVFALDNPASVVVAGAPSGTFDGSCGPQPGRRVRIEYEPPAANRQGIDGVLKSIGFLP